MSYDLAVWEGERPADDARAADVFGRLQDRYQDSDEPPTPRIRAFVDALLSRWPDLTELGDDEVDDSPWAAGPLVEEATGALIYFPLVHSRADEVSAEMAQLAADHGLVCFDPQLEQLRPAAPPRKGWRRWIR